MAGVLVAWLPMVRRMNDRISDRVDAAVARGLLGRGTGHRVELVAHLAGTSLQAGSQSQVHSEPEPQAVLSGEDLGRVLGLSRASVHKHMERLRSLGVAVVPVAGSGYRLDHPVDDLVAGEAVLPLLLTHLDPCVPWMAGLPYKYVPSCRSTNEMLKQRAASLPSGAVLVTDEQTGGRGRLGRTWVSGRREDLTFSVLLHPSLAPAQAHLLSLTAALAVAEVLEDVNGLQSEVGIKWPNDVLLGGEKVCGILLEGAMDADRLQWAVAGIGLNVNSDPQSLIETLVAETDSESEWVDRPRPVSLRARLGRHIGRAPLLAALLTRLTRRWTEPAADDVLDGLRRRDVLAGRMVEIWSGPPGKDLVVVGRATGIGPDGQLLVRDETGRSVAVFAGDVTIRDIGTVAT